MATASSNLQDISTAHEYLVQAERNFYLSQESGLGEDDFSPLHDGDVPDAFWLGAVAMFITEDGIDGIDGNAIVARNQGPILAARAAGYTVGEIAEYAVLKERGRHR
ncbi:hypothetical protein [Arthrobacter sp. CAN_A1]|uniref:hypothetical protein n=1 Tax=Arthrobacter sp. CAN_A1 TaxID=2787717 RepID=UPI0018C96EAF